MKRDRLKNNRPFFIVLLVFLAIVLLGIPGAALIAPGSDVYAEDYAFETSDTVLIQAIQEFQQHQKIHADEKDTFQYNGAFWYYHVHFYSQDSNITYFCYVDPVERNTKTLLRLVSACSGYGFGDCKLVNKDFSRKKNDLIKKDFENNFIKKIGLKYRDEGNGMKLWFIQF